MILEAEKALIAIVRLDQALWQHPLFPAWRRRQTLAEVARWSASDGFPVDVDRLAVVLAGLPLRHVSDGGQLRHAVFLLDRVRDHQAGLEDLEVDDALVHMRNAVGAPSILLAAASGALTSVHSGGGRTAARIAVPVFLREVGLTRAPLPCLSGSKAWDICDDGSQFEGRFLSDLHRCADRGLNQLIDLDRQWRRWRRAASTARSDSSLTLLIDIVTTLQAITPADAARLLGISVPAASKALKRLLIDGVVAEGAPRGSWHVYLAADAARITAEVERVSPAPPDPTRRGEGRRTLDRLEAVVDRVAGLDAPLPEIKDDVRAEAPEDSVLPEVDLGAIIAQADAAMERVKRRLSASIK